MSRQQMADEGGSSTECIVGSPIKLPGDECAAGRHFCDCFRILFPVYMVAWAKTCMHDEILLQTIVMILNWTSPMKTA